MKRRKPKPINAAIPKEVLVSNDVLDPVNASSKPYAAQGPGDDDLEDLVASADAFDALIAEEARRFDERIAERLREVERDCISDDEFDMMLDRVKRERPTTVRGRPGRPSKATEVVVAALCAALERPFPKALAAELVGVNRSTLYDWERAGGAVSRRLARARARGGLYLHLKSLSGGKGSHAARWMLERLFPEDYGISTRAHITRGFDPENS
ncbi:MAG: hypothetical protein ACYCPH_03435 [Minisyncoccota bacterium]